MTGVAALLLQSAVAAQAAAAPLVGDTIWLVRRAAVPSGGAVRAPAWAPTGDIELLGAAQVVSRGDSAELRFPVVAWRAGEHAVDVPGPLLLLAGGGIDSLPVERVTLQVRSLLPAGVPDSALRVQPPAEAVRLGERTVRPLLLLVVLLATLLVPVHLAWRRRGVAPPAPALPAPPALPVARWADAGEGRAALAAAVAALRTTLARRVPAATAALATADCVAAVRAAGAAWPADELAALLAEADAARFRPVPSAASGALAERLLALRDRLEAAA